MAAVGGLRRQEILRVTLADLIGEIEVTQVGQSLADIAAATIAAALDVACAAVAAAQGGQVVEMCIRDSYLAFAVLLAAGLLRAASGLSLIHI